MPSPETKASCCPERNHYARGLCENCYKQSRRKIPEVGARLRAQDRVRYATDPKRRRDTLERGRKWRQENKSRIRQYNRRQTWLRVIM